MASTPESELPAFMHGAPFEWPAYSGPTSTASNLCRRELITGQRWSLAFSGPWPSDF